jgi:hypothetical protein
MKKKKKYNTGFNLNDTTKTVVGGIVVIELVKGLKK